MKNSLLFPLAIISLTLTSCGLTGSKDSACMVDADCAETEMCYFKSEGAIGSCVAKPGTPGVDDVAYVTPLDPAQPENNGVTPTPSPATPPKNTPTTPDNNTPKSDEVSTEELTKELDDFVDEITKGL